MSGLVLLRWRPRRILPTATFGSSASALPLIALARPAPLVVVIVAAFASGCMVEIFGVFWDTTYQQEIPQRQALAPLGLRRDRLVGADAARLRRCRPARRAVGIRATFIGGAVFVVAATALVFLSRDVRNLERREQPAVSYDSRRMLPPEVWASAVSTISSMFTFGGRVSANMIESATSSACSGPPIATFE